MNILADFQSTLGLCSIKHIKIYKIQVENTQW